MQATLKLSGHLINARGWDGRLMLAAKNSADNAFTAAAELLLAQTLGVSLHQHWPVIVHFLQSVLQVHIPAATTSSTDKQQP
jgi:hypothetical protein